VILITGMMVGGAILTAWSAKQNKAHQDPPLSYDPKLEKTRTGAYVPLVPTKKRPRIVFTTTSIPSRLDDPRSIIDLVKNLMQQTVKPDAIHLNIPHYSKRESRPYTVPQALVDYLEKEELGEIVHINRCKDYGPATKLIGCLDKETDPSTLILPVDDDVEFPKQYFEELVAYSTEYPNVVYAYHGLRYNEHHGIPELYTQSTISVDVAETVTGVAYRRRMFTDEIFDIDRRCPCFFTDDIYISAHVASKGFGRQLLMSDPDRVAQRGRKGMPLMHEYDAPNPLYLENLDQHSGNNVRCMRGYRSLFKSHRTHAYA